MGKRTGSIGNCEFPGRVQPGKKMPGQYGNTNVSLTFKSVTAVLEQYLFLVQRLHF